MNLAQGAARGAAWNLATVVAERGFGFLILGLLLRSIPASTVGLIAIASAISDLARTVATSGAGEQVQASPGDKQIEAGAFWSQFLASLAFMAVLWAAAPWIAGLYGQAVLVPVLRLMAFNIVLTAFLVVPAARLTTDFNFRTLGLISLGSTITGGLVALPFAFGGEGLSALIYQRMVGIAFFAIAAAICARWMPPAPPPLKTLKESFRFSYPLMQASMVDYVSLTGYVMIAGLRISLGDIGLFRIAQRLIEVLQEVAFLPARKVFMPVFVAVRNDPARRLETVRQMLDMLAMAIFFASAICGAAAVPIVQLMFGPHWAAAGPVFAILTLLAPVAALYGTINPLLTAVGRTPLVSRYATINMLSIVAVVWVAAPYGLTALAIALALRGALSVYLFALAIKQGLDAPAWPYLRQLLLPLAALCLARLAAYGVETILPPLPAFEGCLVLSAIAAGVFAATVIAAAPQRMSHMTARLQRALLGRRIA